MRWGSKAIFVNPFIIDMLGKSCKQGYEYIIVHSGSWRHTRLLELKIYDGTIHVYPSATGLV
jgi:hypothetical protein